jgi:glycine/D-amino acid oxidase-like deaminating enzyme
MRSSSSSNAKIGQPGGSGSGKAHDPAALTATLWGATAPAAPRFPALTESIKADVAVVGGGITGLAAALFLAELGAEVVLVEAGGVGTGAVGRSSGLVNAGMWVPPDQIRATLGPVYGDRLLNLLGDAPKEVFGLIDRHGIECDLEPVGTLQCAVGPDGMATITERAASWQRMGADVAILDARETARRVGSPFYAGALLDNRTGTVQPLSYARGLARAAKDAGAAIFCDTPARGFGRHAGHWRVATPKGEVRAMHLLAATDTYSLTDHFGIKSEFIDLPYFNIATEPMRPDLLGSVLRSRQAITDTRKVLSSYRLDRDGRLVVGSIGNLSGMGSGAHKRWARRAIARLFPQLTGIRLEYGWHGRIGMTGTHLPALHALGPGAYSIGGYNGRGIAAGTAFGKAFAHFVTGRLQQHELPLPVTPFQPAQLRKLKECAYALSAQAAHIVGARGRPA